ncbi:hypothetical protein DSM05_02605 [Pseudomonas sp. FW305-3-2-15-E-TSA4]|nr:hypothetical protein [Pseudomonas sp. FW305-3-2-15-E-TSA4]
MSSGIIQNLAHSVRTIAEHPDASARFGMAVGLICDISLQSDLDGLWIAVERGVLDYDHPTDEQDFARGLGVPRVRNEVGEVIDLLVAETDWLGHGYVELAREIALLEDPEARVVVLEAAAVRLIGDGEDPLDDLLAQVARARCGGLGIDQLGIPLAAQPRAKAVEGDMKVGR